MTIAVDYDGTIADTNSEKSRWINEHLNMNVAPWDCNRTDCVPIIGLQAYEEMARWVYGRDSTEAAHPVPGAIRGLRKLAARHTLVLLSARTDRRLGFARKWIKRHGIADLFAECRSSSTSSKGAVCREIGAEVLIDDDPRHLSDPELSWLKKRILLQHGRIDAPPRAEGIDVCTSWQEVVQVVEAL